MGSLGGVEAGGQSVQGAALRGRLKYLWVEVGSAAVALCAAALVTLKLANGQSKVDEGPLKVPGREMALSAFIECIVKSLVAVCDEGKV